jgi:hypothetical protein
MCDCYSKKYGLKSKVSKVIEKGICYTMIEVIFKIFLTDYIDFQGFIIITKRIQKPLLIEYS